MAVELQPGFNGLDEPLCAVRRAGLRGSGSIVVLSDHGSSLPPACRQVKEGAVAAGPEAG